MGSVNQDSGRRSRHPEVVTRIARYFYAWGLTDGPTLARVTYGMLRESEAAGQGKPAEQLQFAMDRLNQWVDHLAARVEGDPDLDTRRLRIVARLKEALGQYPDAFLESEPPADFIEIVASPTPRVTPPAAPSAMKPQHFGHHPSPFRSVFWWRLLRRIKARLISAADHASPAAPAPRDSSITMSPPTEPTEPPPDHSA